MTIARVSLSSLNKGPSKKRSVLAGNDPILSGAYESIATVALSGNQTVISFTSIPSTYQHLQLRITARSSVSDWASIKFNSDSTGSNYRWHLLYGDGSSTGASNGTGNSLGVLTFLGNSSNVSNAVIDILDYKSSVKHKTVRSLGGYDGNGSSQVNFISNLWFPSSVASISQIDIQLNSSGTFQQYSHFALYGIR